MRGYENYILVDINNRRQPTAKVIDYKCTFVDLKILINGSFDLWCKTLNPHICCDILSICNCREKKLHIYSANI